MRKILFDMEVSLLTIDNNLVSYKMTMTIDKRLVFFFLQKRRKKEEILTRLSFRVLPFSVYLIAQISDLSI